MKVPSDRGEGVKTIWSLPLHLYGDVYSVSGLTLVPYQAVQLQIPSCPAFRCLSNRFERSGSDNPATLLTAPRAHIDDIIRIAYHIQVVFDDHYGSPPVNQGLENAQQYLHIQRMQPDGRFVENEHGIRLHSPHSLASFNRCASPPERPGVSSPSVR